jgi:hypothetical protein
LELQKDELGFLKKIAVLSNIMKYCNAVFSELMQIVKTEVFSGQVGTERGDFSRFIYEVKNEIYQWLLACQGRC